METIDSALKELGVNEEGESKGRRQHNDPKKEYKSKNLEAERRRRGKLSGRLLELRALVPIVTKMTKAAIFEDAITYIQELQKLVSDLSDQLDDPEASSCEEDTKPKIEQIDAAMEMKKYGIEEYVKVSPIDGNKLWVKMILQKKKGGLTKLMEAVRTLGFEFTDTSLTTDKGAVLVTSVVEGICGANVAGQHARELLLETVRGT